MYRALVNGEIAYRQLNAPSAWVKAETRGARLQKIKMNDTPTRSEILCVCEPDEWENGREGDMCVRERERVYLRHI